MSNSVKRIGRAAAALLKLLTGSSIFFLFAACGLPKNPFFIGVSDVILEPDSANQIIKPATAGAESLGFSIEYFRVYESNGINLFYCYSKALIASPDSVMTSLIDPTAGAQPQVVAIEETQYQVFRYSLNAASQPQPTAAFDEVSASDILAGSMEIIPDGGGGSYRLDLFIELGGDPDTIPAEGTLIPASGSSESPFINIETYPDMADDLGIGPGESYYLFLFASIYAAEPSDISYDNPIARSYTVYLGRVELQRPQEI